MNNYRQCLAENYREQSTEELIALHDQGTLTEAAYSVLEAELEKRGIAPPRRPQQKSFQDTDLQSMRAHWEGRASLTSAFWLIGGSAHFLFLLLLELFFVPYQLGIAPLPGSTDTSLMLYWLWCYLIAIDPLIFAYICIWRCSSNTTSRGWTYLARLALFLNLPNIFLLSLWPVL